MQLVKKLFLMFAMAAVAAGCSGKSGSVSVSAVNSSTATGRNGAAIDLGNGISVDRVRVVVRKVKLEHLVAAGDAGTGSPDAGVDDHGGNRGSGLAAPRGAFDHGADDGLSGDDDADEIKIGPFLVDLSGDQLSGGISQVFDGQVPAGTYRELKIKIGPVTSGSSSSGSPDGGSSDAGATVPAGIADLNGASVVVDGTVDGTAFSFVSRLTAEVEREGSIEVGGATTPNVTLSVPIAGWFKAADGSRLDPSLASNQQAIERNIKASIDAFDDDDHDGHDDHGGHGADDGANHK